MLTNSNFYIGDSSISRLYQGDNLVWDASHPDIILSYIANGPDDNSGVKKVYFDTGIIPNASTKVEISCSAYTIDKGVNVPVLSGVDANWRGLTICIPMNSGTVTARLGGSYVDGPQIASNTKYTITTYQSTSTQGDMIVNGTAYSHATTDVYGTTSAYLFAYNVNGTTNTTASHTGMKIYYCKVWEANNLIRFYIPVLHYINGQYTPCFYDKVNDTYIYNLGTDTPTYKISGDYLLDWIGPQQESNIPNTTGYTGFQFDTGVVASNALSVDIKGRLVWGFENNLFASATDNVSTPTWKTFGFTTSGGSTDADKCRLVFQWGAHNSGTVRTFISMDSSALVEPHKISMFFDASRGNGYLDGSLYTSSYDTWDFSPNTMYLLNRHNNSVTTTAGAGARCYYANFTISNVPTKTYLPVLHNNQAAFLDLNSGTYIYNMGTQIPYYELNR